MYVTTEGFMCVCMSFVVLLCMTDSSTLLSSFLYEIEVN